MPRAERSNNLTPSARSTAATCCEMPDCVAFSRSAARVNEPSSQAAMTARTWRSAMSAMRYPSRKLIPRSKIYYFGRADRKARILAEEQEHPRARCTGARCTGRVHGNGQLRHRWIRLAATRQLGSVEEIPDRARARAHEEARPRRRVVHVRRERALSHRHAHARVESAQAGAALRAPLRR